jgi:hypothetical protein
VAAEAAAVHFTLDDPDGATTGLRLSRRLRKAGFVLHVAPGDGRSEVLVVPPVATPIATMGRGRILKVDSAAQDGLAIVSADFGSAAGTPLVAR